MNDLARRVVDSVRLRDVMEYYGLRFNSRGFAKCPFHTEKTASLTIKNEHYKCFGCGAYGGVIDFVMEYHGIGFKQALIRLNSDFNLGLTLQKSTYRDRLQMAENRRIETAKKKRKADIHNNYLTLCQVHSILFRRMINGEEWLVDTVKKLDILLNDFTGEEARAWKTTILKSTQKQTS